MPVLWGSLVVGLGLILFIRTRAIGFDVVLGAGAAWVALFLWLFLVVEPHLHDDVESARSMTGVRTSA